MYTKLARVKLPRCNLVQHIAYSKSNLSLSQNATFRYSLSYNNNVRITIIRSLATAKKSVSDATKKKISASTKKASTTVDDEDIDTRKSVKQKTKQSLPEEEDDDEESFSLKQQLGKKMKTVKEEEKPRRKKIQEEEIPPEEEEAEDEQRDVDAEEDWSASNDKDITDDPQIDQVWTMLESELLQQQAQKNQEREEKDRRIQERMTSQAFQPYQRVQFTKPKQTYSNTLSRMDRMDRLEDKVTGRIASDYDNRQHEHFPRERQDRSERTDNRQDRTERTSDRSSDRQDYRYTDRLDYKDREFVRSYNDRLFAQERQYSDRPSERSTERQYSDRPSERSTERQYNERSDRQYAEGRPSERASERMDHRSFDRTVQRQSDTTEKDKTERTSKTNRIVEKNEPISDRLAVKSDALQGQIVPGATFLEQFQQQQQQYHQQVQANIQLMQNNQLLRQQIQLLQQLVNSFQQLFPKPADNVTNQPTKTQAQEPNQEDVKQQIAQQLLNVAIKGMQAEKSASSASSQQTQPQQTPTSRVEVRTAQQQTAVDEVKIQHTVPTQQATQQVQQTASVHTQTVRQQYSKQTQPQAAQQPPQQFQQQTVVSGIQQQTVAAQTTTAPVRTPSEEAPQQTQKPASQNSPPRVAAVRQDTSQSQYRTPTQQPQTQAKQQTAPQAQPQTPPPQSQPQQQTQSVQAEKQTAPQPQQEAPKPPSQARTAPQKTAQRTTAQEPAKAPTEQPTPSQPPQQVESQTTATAKPATTSQADQKAKPSTPQQTATKQQQPRTQNQPVKQSQQPTKQPDQPPRTQQPPTQSQQPRQAQQTASSQPTQPQATQQQKPAEANGASTSQAQQQTQGTDSAYSRQHLLTWAQKKAKEPIKPSPTTVQELEYIAGTFQRIMQKFDPNVNLMQPTPVAVAAPVDIPPKGTAQHTTTASPSSSSEQPKPQGAKAAPNQPAKPATAEGTPKPKEQQKQKPQQEQKQQQTQQKNGQNNQQTQQQANQQPNAYSKQAPKNAKKTEIDKSTQDKLLSLVEGLQTPAQHADSENLQQVSSWLSNQLKDIRGKDTPTTHSTILPSPNNPMRVTAAGPSKPFAETRKLAISKLMDALEQYEEHKDDIEPPIPKHQSPAVERASHGFLYRTHHHNPDYVEALLPDLTALETESSPQANEFKNAFTRKGSSNALTVIGEKFRPNLEASGISMIPSVISPPRLAHGLEKVLYQPGIHWAKDLYDGSVWNSYLVKIHQPHTINYDVLPKFMQPSTDTSLNKLAVQNNCSLTASTSSITQLLTAFHLLYTGYDDLTDFIGSAPTNKRVPRAATYLVLRCQDGGVYSMDKPMSKSGNILTTLGRSLERMLTMEPEEFEKKMLKANNPEPFVDSEAFTYMKMDGLLVRSQLDCWDPALPAPFQAFDLKTRATSAIRMDVENYERQSAYKLSKVTGPANSYEKEFRDLVHGRTLLKYYFQVKIGSMAGVFVAYHNTKEIFGFEFVSVSEMEKIYFGDHQHAEFEFISLVNIAKNVLSKITSSYPEQDLCILFGLNQHDMDIFVAPCEAGVADEVLITKPAHSWYKLSITPVSKNLPYAIRRNPIGPDVEVKYELTKMKQDSENFKREFEAMKNRTWQY